MLQKRKIKGLSFSNHDRDYENFKYVYPVLSRRSDGISVGINLNVNNTCNWRCIYCQVPNLKRGKPNKVNLFLLEIELDSLITDIISKKFNKTISSDKNYDLKDIAISGNGEPTLSKQFSDVVNIIYRVKDKHQILKSIKTVLITNGSMILNNKVYDALKIFKKMNGEVWFKVDSVCKKDTKRINDVIVSQEIILKKIKKLTLITKVWIQTSVFFYKKKISLYFFDEYIKFLKNLKKNNVEINGVMLYRLARKSMQKEACNISNIEKDELIKFKEKIESAGMDVKLGF